jgi:hypothetical protein
MRGGGVVLGTISIVSYNFRGWYTRRAHLEGIQADYNQDWGIGGSCIGTMEGCRKLGFTPRGRGTLVGPPVHRRHFENRSTFSTRAPA